MMEIDFQRPMGGEVEFHARITEKGTQAQAGLHAPVAHPSVTPDDNLTFEERYQAAMFGFDNPFAGVQRSRTEGLDALYKRHKKPNTDEAVASEA